MGEISYASRMLSFLYNVFVSLLHAVFDCILPEEANMYSSLVEYVKRARIKASF